MRFLDRRFGLKTTRACELVGLWRSTRNYKAKNKDKDGKLRKRILDLTDKYPRWGCPMVHMVVKREELVINKKRTERIYYREQQLSLRRRKRRRKAHHTRREVQKATRPDERWAMDFMHDSLWGGRKMRILTVIDTYTKESLRIEVNTSVNGVRVTQVLDDLLITRGKPKLITVDNGPEFSGRAMDKWAYENGVKLDFIRPGKPSDNCYIESFNGTLRNECLNMHYFESVTEAKMIIENWRQEYNEFRPHSSLCGLPPAEFAGNYNCCNTDNLHLELVQ